MKTKFGNTKIQSNGYYQITSGKEGNHMKLLHRLIYEDFYKVTLLPWTVIHHIDGDKLNNNINNLKAMRKEEHNSLHKIGENHHNYGNPNNYHPSVETKQKMSESRNTSGYLNVYKQKDKRYKQGFAWKYTFYENGKQKSITSVNIEKLEAKVEAKGLKWLKY